MTDVFDFRLTIDGTEYGFFVAEEDGIEQWGDGLAPFITPQFRTDPFGYDHTPPEIEVPVVAELWNGGAGFESTSSTGSTQILTYNYSRGLDLSQNDRIFVSPRRQTMLEADGTAIGGQPVKFLNTSDGFFMIAGQFIYEWELVPKQWVQRDDASADGQNFKDIIELDGTIYVSRGTNADYKYSTDGITWSAFTDTDENADYFTTRGNSSDIAAIWKVLSNLIKNTTDGKNGAVAWSGADEVGHTGENVTGLITVDNDILVFKREGIYVYDGTNTQDLWKTTFTATDDGKNPYLWINGRIYVPYGGTLLEFDARDTDSMSLRQVYPLEGMDSKEIKGTITATAGDRSHMYLAVKNVDGNTYIMKGKPGQYWHTFAYLGANDCNALYAAGPGVVHATNPCLVFGFGSTAANYFILPRNDFNPGNDPNYQFDTGEGTVYGPWVNFGAKTYRKFLNKGSVLGGDLSAARVATLKYQLDIPSAAETTLVTANSGTLTETDTTTEVVFNQIRYVLTMITDVSFSPFVDSIALFATLNPKRKRVWNPIIALSDSLYARGGVLTSQLPSTSLLREILFNAATKRITMTDNDEHTHTVRLLGIESAGRVKKQWGGREHYAYGYKLSLVEINSTATGQTEAIYGSSTYGSGHVYA